MLLRSPQKKGRQNADTCNEQKAEKRFIQCDPQMEKDRFIQHHIPETARDFGRAAKHKGINHPALGSPFPEYEKDDKDQDSKKVDQKVMAFLQVQILLLSVRTCCHLGSAPSIKD